MSKRVAKYYTRFLISIFVLSCFSIALSGYLTSRMFDEISYRIPAFLTLFGGMIGTYFFHPDSILRSMVVILNNNKIEMEDYTYGTFSNNSLIKKNIYKHVVNCGEVNRDLHIITKYRIIRDLMPYVFIAISKEHEKKKDLNRSFK